MVLVDQVHVGCACLGHRGNEALLIRGPDEVGDIGNLVLKQLMELACFHVEGADAGRRASATARDVDGAIRGAADDPHVLAIRLGRADEAPPALRITAVKLTAFLEFAGLAATGGTDCESRLLARVQRDAAVVCGCTRDGTATPGDRVHHHHFGTGALCRTRVVDGHQHVARIVAQRVQQREAFVADLAATLGGVEGAVKDQWTRLRAVGVDREPLAGLERLRIPTLLAHRVEHQPLGAGPMERAHAFLVGQLVDLEDLQVAGAHHREHVLVAPVHGHREVLATGRDLHRAVGRMLDEVNHRDRVVGPCNPHNAEYR